MRHSEVLEVVRVVYEAWKGLAVALWCFCPG